MFSVGAVAVRIHLFVFTFHKANEIGIDNGLNQFLGVCEFLFDRRHWDGGGVLVCQIVLGGNFLGALEKILKTEAECH